MQCLATYNDEGSTLHGPDKWLRFTSREMDNQASGFIKGKTPYTDQPFPLPEILFFNRLLCFFKRHYISIDCIDNIIHDYKIKTMSNYSKFSSGNELIPLDPYMTETC